MTGTSSSRHRAMWIILLLAILLRVAVACWPVIHHADELWQYLEPARKLTGRPWIATWEARSGARSWLLPMLFAGPMEIGHGVAPLSLLDIILPRLLCVMISIGLVLGAARLGFAISRIHGLVAAFVAATWYELVYFGPRTMSEPIATALFLAAAALLLTRSEGRWKIAAGVLLGLCCVVRFQYAPAALVLALASSRSDVREWARLAIGGALALVISAIADLLGGAVPFLWIARNLTLNLVANRSADFGVAPPWWYLEAIWALWGWGTIPILLGAVIGARRYPALLTAAVMTLAVHMLVPHKEYRFVLLTTTLLVVLAAIGSVDLLQQRFPHARAGIALGSFWILLSAFCGATGSSAHEWGNSGRLIAAWRLASQVRAACAIGIYRPDHALVASHVLLGRDVPIYQIDLPDRLEPALSAAFNVVLTPWERRQELHGYTPLGCGDRRVRDLCVFRRPGGCERSAEGDRLAIDRVLRRKDI